MSALTPVFMAITLLAGSAGSENLDKRGPFVLSDTTVVSQSTSCDTDGFASFDGLRGFSQDERAEAETLANRAVEYTGLPPCESRVTYVDSGLWDTVDLFRIEHGSCHSLTARVIAVERNGTSHLLTGDLPRLGPGGDVISSIAEALPAFNRLTTAHEIRINDRGDAAEYLEFFLSVFLQRAGSYIPDVELADRIGALKAYSQESELLRSGLKQVHEPVVEILEPDGNGFHGRSFNWYWWYGGIRRFDLRITWDGQIEFRETDYANQE